jgi:PIN domain nuclease of toxin-antitoxin system
VVPFVRYLLDTHAWIWTVLDSPRLSPRARKALADLADDERVGLAAISLKEAAWHAARGRLQLPDGGMSWQDWLREASRWRFIEILPLTVEVAIESERFSDRFPTDPADRMIAATARLHDLTLVTVDGGLGESADVATLW